VHAQVRLYDRLFRVPQPGRDGDFLADLNPDSLRVIDEAVLEPSLGEAGIGERFQFEREGYFCRDREDTTDGRPVFNQIVSLRDSWGG